MKEKNTYILHHISAYLSGELSKKEHRILRKWLNEDPENKILFTKYLYFYKKSQRIGFIENLDTEKAWNKLSLKIKETSSATLSKNTKPKVSFLYPIHRFFKYAAILVIALGSAYFLKNYTSNNQQNSPINSEEQITLELENGNVNIIDADGNKKITDKFGKIVGNQKGNSIDYQSENEIEELIYNKLTIPYGKKFQISLSDGTKVHLNAGTTLKYPVKFIKGQNRQIFLLSGEAYFEVTKDSSHPFIVNSNSMNVRVLGTEFNISSYPEDPSVNTVLVEGAVSIYGNDNVYNKENTSILNPGYKASWDKSNNNISFKKVDTSIYTGWKEGKLIFKNMLFKNIITKLERHYNVSIINNNKKLGEQYYDATFDIETIEQVLNSFNKSYKINYTIKNNRIIIN